jgi:hypothetical protein
MLTYIPYDPISVSEVICVSHQHRSILKWRDVEVDEANNVYQRHPNQAE